MVKYILALMLVAGALPALAQNAAPAMSAGTGPGVQIKPDRIESQQQWQQQQQLSVAEIRKIPVIQNILQGGAELYYLGERSGMQGFLVYKSGEVQVFYMPPDQQTLIFGAMYSMDAANVTAQQITLATTQNPQLRGIMMAATEQQREFEKDGIAALNGAPAGKAGLPGMAALSPGERLFRDFEIAAGNVVGQADRPLLMMLVDPLCPHCRATWKALKDTVTSGALRVKLIPIGPESSERERMAAMFLRAQEPLKVWNKLADGDQAALAGTPTETELGAVRAAMRMAEGWKITATPYLVYRGKDGKVKVVQGEPEKMAAVISDLAP